VLYARRMSVFWIFTGMGLTAAFVLAVWSSTTRRKYDLGFVSSQWVNEYRQSNTANTNR